MTAAHRADRQDEQTGSLVDRCCGERIACIEAGQYGSNGLARFTAIAFVATDDGGAVDRALECAIGEAGGIERVATDGQISDLPGCASRAAQQPTFGDDTHANTAADAEIGKVTGAAGLALPQLAQGGELDTVLDGQV